MRARTRSEREVRSRWTPPAPRFHPIINPGASGRNGRSAALGWPEHARPRRCHPRRTPPTRRFHPTTRADRLNPGASGRHGRSAAPGWPERARIPRCHPRRTPPARRFQPIIPAGPSRPGRFRAVRARRSARIARTCPDTAVPPDPDASPRTAGPNTCSGLLDVGVFERHGRSAAPGWPEHARIGRCARGPGRCSGVSGLRPSPRPIGRLRGRSSRRSPCASGRR